MSPKSHSRNLSRLADVLGACVYQALGLRESLQDERAALEADDLDALQLAVDNKTRCVSELRQLERERSDIASEMGFDPGAAQMDDLTRELGQDATIKSRWQHLLDVASECNTLNMSNGAIIRIRKQQVDAGLAVLRGAEPTAEIYGFDGASAPGYDKRSLAEA